MQKRKKMPRDIIAQFITKKIKEDILRTQYKTLYEIEGKKIIVMKEDFARKKEILKTG